MRMLLCVLMYIVVAGQVVVAVAEAMLGKPWPIIAIGLVSAAWFVSLWSAIMGGIRPAIFILASAAYFVAMAFLLFQKWSYSHADMDAYYCLAMSLVATLYAMILMVPYRGTRR